MTLDEVSQCLVVISENDNEARDAALGRLRELNEKDSFPNLMVTVILDSRMPRRLRALAIYVCHYFQTLIPAKAFPQLLACLDSDDTVLLNSLAGLIGRHLHSDADVAQVLELPPRYFRGQIRVLCAFIEMAKSSDIAAPIPDMLLSVLASDVDTASKVLAAKALQHVFGEKVEVPGLESVFAGLFWQDLNENSISLLIALRPI
jgi:hypothetical protein